MYFGLRLRYSYENLDSQAEIILRLFLFLLLLWILLILHTLNKRGSDFTDFICYRAKRLFALSITAGYSSKHVDGSDVYRGCIRLQNSSLFANKLCFLFDYVFAFEAVSQWNSKVKKSTNQKRLNFTVIVNILKDILWKLC